MTHKFPRNHRHQEPRECSKKHALSLSEGSVLSGGERKAATFLTRGGVLSIREARQKDENAADGFFNIPIHLVGMGVKYLTGPEDNCLGLTQNG